MGIQEKSYAYKASLVTKDYNQHEGGYFFSTIIHMLPDSPFP